MAGNILTSAERARTFYRLKRTPRPDHHEGDSQYEWFELLRDAHNRRMDIIASQSSMASHERDRDLRIERVTFEGGFGKYELALLLLNRQLPIESVLVVEDSIDGGHKKSPTYWQRRCTK